MQGKPIHCACANAGLVLVQALGGGRHALPYPLGFVALRSSAVDLKRSLNGATCGAVAAAVWAAQQPADKHVFGSGYDDVELLGKLALQGEAWPLAGIVLHLGAGMTLGALYAQLRPFLPGPPVARAVTVALVEHVALWPLGRLVDRYHPARKELAPLTGNGRAFAQASWRHLVFGLVLGELERRLNAEGADEPPEVPVSSNGHGNLELAVGAA